MFEKIAVPFLVVANIVGYTTFGIAGYAMAHGEPLRGSFQASCRLLGLM